MLQSYSFDQNLSEEKIRELYCKNQEKNFCSLMTEDEDYNYMSLYSSTHFSLDDKVTYDCGNGEKLFDAKNFIPKKELIKEMKDINEIQSQADEANCYKAASKLLTNNIMACWRKEIFKERERLNDYEGCRALAKDEYKKYLQGRFKGYLGNNDKIEEIWNCVDRNGNKTEIYMNTITGKFKLT